jgi:hypothetical protein
MNEKGGSNNSDEVEAQNNLFAKLESSMHKKP